MSWMAEIGGWPPAARGSAPGPGPHGTQSRGVVVPRGEVEDGAPPAARGRAPWTPIFSLFLLSGTAWAQSPGAHPTDYPTSVTFLSPAELARFGGTEVAVDTAYRDEHDRALWSGQSDTAQETASYVTFRFVRKATPSLYWDAVVTHDAEYVQTGDTATTGGTPAGEVRSATTGGVDAAYKILDRLVVALGAQYRRAAASPAGATPWSLDEGLFTQAVMLEGESGELGWAQTQLVYQGQFFRETLAHARWHFGPDFLLAGDVQWNPQPPCCLGEQTSRILFGATPAWQSGPLTTEARLTYSPAYIYGADYDVARTGLTLQLFYDLGSWALAARAGYDFGHQSNANVLIPGPLGPVTTADVLDIGRELAVSATWRL